MLRVVNETCWCATLEMGSFSCMMEQWRMENLIKSLRTFFSYLYEHNLKWQNSIQKAKKPLNGLCNQSEQLRLVKK